MDVVTHVLTLVTGIAFLCAADDRLTRFSGALLVVVSSLLLFADWL